jgi:tetratricopeptide (TPR) repeat protein
VEVSAFSRTIFIAVPVLLSILAVPEVSRGGTAAWYRARSESFVVLGDVGAQQVGSIAGRLEEFRAVFSQVLGKGYFDHRAPTVVMVFGDETEYGPFRPLLMGRQDQFVNGYFKSTPDVNYITLVARGTTEEIASVVFHEYVHSLVRNRYGRAPVWFDEGLAEYYSVYELTGGGRRVRVGKRLAGRIEYLRTHGLLPLEVLLKADRQSSLYNEHDQRSIFYAQSWALVHYLLSDRTGERARMLSHFLSLQAAGVGVEDGIRQAFQMDIKSLESRLGAYVRAGQYAERVEALSRPQRRSAAVEAHHLGEASTQGYLGDLLLRTDRPSEARPYLENALRLDPNLTAAHLSLGVLHLYEGQLAQAREHLQKAIWTAPRNHLAHYYYAEYLRRESSEAENAVAGYQAKTALIRAELERVIELAPEFLDAYGLLALVDIERSLELAEAVRLLGYIMTEAPERQEFKLLLAQLYLRQGDFARAREQLNPLTRNALADTLVRAEAQTLLDKVSAAEAQAAERIKRGETGPKEAAREASTLPCDMPAPGPQIKGLRFAGQQVCGRLVRVECAERGILLFVNAGERTLRLHTEAFNRIRFVTYTSEIKGHFECGERAAAQPVLITYNPAQGDNTAFDGELTAVEFVPEDWLH